MYIRNPKWYRDEIILALDLYFDKDLGPIESSNPKIIELSELLNKLPLFEYKPDKQKFRNSNGVKLKLANFKAIDPEYKGKGMASYSKLDKEVFKEYYNDKMLLNRLANEIKKVVNSDDLVKYIEQIEEDELTETDSVREGQVLYKVHKVRERDRGVVESKKKKVLSKQGELKCEACWFDFEKKYGELGKGYIECHHCNTII